jgi:hypothetical protein
VNKKEVEKILKYKHLVTEIQRMWKVKAKVTPLLIGANGTISKSLRQYLSNITGEQEINPLKTKRRLLYLKTHSVPSCKQFSSRL